MRTLPAEFAAYRWAPSTEELARRAGLDAVEIVRFDGNVPAAPLPSSRPAAIASTLAEINTYPHGGYADLERALAEYAGVEPANVVLGAGADDLILLCARSFAGPGDAAAIPAAPTYPLFRIAVELAGADVGDEDPAFAFACRPNNPTGEVGELPAVRPLVVDEAYFEYAGVTAAAALDDGIVVVRTLSKAFALAGARVGYALAAPDVADELRRRQAPAPISTLSAALAVAALSQPPDVAAQVAERERVAGELRALGLPPLPSSANFLYVPTPDAGQLGDQLLRAGLVVRVFDGALRVSIRDREDDDLLLDALARARGGAPATRPQARRVRHVRATAETRQRVRLGLDGPRCVRVATGAGLYDHFLEQLAFHAGFDLVLEGDGDTENGPHHATEDAALALGEAVSRALGDRAGIARYGDAVVPMDEALARAAVDLGGRPWAEVDLDPPDELARHVLCSFAQAGRLAVHADSRGRDAHHTAEAAFKAVGRALRSAVATSASGGVPSTKGRL